MPVNDAENQFDAENRYQEMRSGSGAAEASERGKACDISALYVEADLDPFDRPLPLGKTLAHKCAICICSTVMCLYFLPMLSFIPLALMGGIQQPSPWDANYNKGVDLAPGAANVTGPSVHFDHQRDVPGPIHGDEWYWNPALVMLFMGGMPICIFSVMCFCKRFVYPDESGDAGEKSTGHYVY